jgi:ABC-2 type transport system permease protein
MAVLAWVEKGLRLGIDSGWLIGKIVGRLLVSVIPGTWMMAGDVMQRARDLNVAADVRGPVAASDLIFQSSWAAVATPETIVGALAGIGMIAAAIWLRRRRE